MWGRGWVVVRDSAGRFVRRVRASSSDHAEHLKRDLERTFDPTHVVAVEMDKR
jgi:hypothetical protein